MQLEYGVYEKYTPMYEPGSECYHVTITDPETRYIKIPWEMEYHEIKRGWIETLPLRTIIYAPNEKTMKERIAWFNENYPTVMIRATQKYIECDTTYVTRYVTPQEVHESMLKNGNEETFEIFPMKLNNIKEKDLIPSDTLIVSRVIDTIYDIENVDSILADPFTFDPSVFTKEEPIVLYRSQYCKYLFKIKDPSLPIRFKACYTDQKQFPTKFTNFYYESGQIQKYYRPNA